MTREEVLTKLREGFIQIEFEKADGSMRQMIATLEEGVVPPKAPAGGNDETSRKKADTACAVWDIDAAGWRSFRWDKLRMFDGVDVPNGIQ